MIDSIYLLITKPIFRSIPDFTMQSVIIRLLFAAVAGGILGLERKYHGKAIGSRTTSIVCVASALISCYGDYMVYKVLEHNILLGTTNQIALLNHPDPIRVSAQIVSGIGFLGAGIILNVKGRIQGITTAAIIWVAACLGIVIGSGAFVISIIAFLIIICCLFIFIDLGTILSFRKFSSYRYLIEYKEDVSFEGSFSKYGIILSHLEIVNLKKREDDVYIVSKIKLISSAKDEEVIKSVLKKLNISIVCRLKVVEYEVFRNI